MTTTELINLLKSVEYGGITKKPRVVSLEIPTLGLLVSPEFIINCTGDGIAGPEVSIIVNGGRLYREENYPEDEPLIPTWEEEC